jgi:hypothetical protein
MANITFAQIPGTGDIKVLNYALALEALEADLYRQALLRLQGGGDVNGITVPGLGLGDNEVDVKYVKEFARVEREHRDFLNNALGSASIIGTGTNGILRNAIFDFNIQTLSRQQVIDLLYTVENTGVQAYLGAIPSLATKTYLAVAAGIQATEARHTAAIAIVRNLLFGPTLNTAPLANDNNGIDKTLLPDAVLAAVGPNIIIPVVAT